MRSIDAAQRRARLAVRHRLAPSTRVDDAEAITRSLVVLHATDPATVFLSVAARSRELEPAHIEKALYTDRTMLRMLAMRRTMFVAPIDLVPALQAACADAQASKQRRTYARHLAQVVDDDIDTWLAEVEEQTHRELLSRGSATGAQLGAAVPRLRTQVDTAPGKPYSEPTAITSWVLLILGCEGRIVRGRPNGSWASTQYVWEPIESWLPAGVPAMTPESARTELVRRWLHTFGPAPVADLKWWTGWPLGEVRKTLAQLDIAEVGLDGATGVLLAEDLDPIPEPEPGPALLPALDPTPMGWQDREWFLGPHRAALFDTSGNIGPTVWWGGRVVGGWAQRADGEIAWRALEDIGREATERIAAEAARIEAWYGDVRAIPRSRTPLERELSG